MHEDGLIGVDEHVSIGFSSMKNGRFRRLGEQHRRVVKIEVDGRPISAYEGDMVLAAVLALGDRLRQSEFDPGYRAGFCLMGACQDCWMWTTDGQRLRACTTPVDPAHQLLTQAPSDFSVWPRRA